MWKTTLILKIKYGLQWLLVQYIKGESMEANDLSHILYKLVCCINNKIFQMLPRFSQNLTLQEAIETVAQMNKELQSWAK